MSVRMDARSSCALVQMDHLDSFFYAKHIPHTLQRRMRLRRAGTNTYKHTSTSYPFQFTAECKPRVGYHLQSNPVPVHTSNLYPMCYYNPRRHAATSINICTFVAQSKMMQPASTSTLQSRCLFFAFLSLYWNVCNRQSHACPGMG